MEDLAREYDAVNLVADPLYGYIKITKRGAVRDAPAEQDLLDDPWLQRLRRIHQLQSAWWVFPSGEHSRFQHALGAMHLAGEWARQVYPNLRVVAPDTPSGACVEETLRVAGLLHDVGHGPFGHFFDQNYLDRFHSDHEVIGRQLILGPLADLIREQRASPSGAFEPGEQVEPQWVAELIADDPLPGAAPPRWVRLLKPILCGTYTADNLDYVARDAYMCGVAVGPVDVPRLLHYTFLGEDGMLLHQHGTQALLMFLNARLYLYTNLYFHRTVRRIDLHMREIFRETIDELLPGDPLANLSAYQGLTDWSLIESVTRWKHATGTLQRLGLEWDRIVRRELKWRMLFEDYSELTQVPAGVAPPTPVRVLALLREQLPAELRDAALEVDVASLDARPQNPLHDRGSVRLYNPISRTVESSPVAELFRRLPIRTTLLRVFTDDAARAEPLRQAVEATLVRRDVLLGLVG